MDMQYRIIYSKNFYRDLDILEYFLSKCDINYDYLRSTIKEDIEYLKYMPRIHKTLYLDKDPNGEYRRIVSGKYIIIYKIEKNKVIILRIFSHKQDYLNQESFILKEKSAIYNKNIKRGGNIMEKAKKLKNSFSKENMHFTHIITEEEALERYMIKLIDEAEEHLANGEETITLEQWQEEIRRKYNVAV